MRYLTYFLLVIFWNLTYSQKPNLDRYLERGEYQELKKICVKSIQGDNTLLNRIKFKKNLNTSLINLHDYDNYLNGIKEVRESNPNNINNRIYYLNEMSNYYRFQKRIDSALYYSNKSMVLLKENQNLVDTDLKYEVYSRFADIHRNRGVKNFNKITPLSMGWDERNDILNRYLDTSLTYSSKNYQRVDINFKKGLIYLDGVSNNRTSTGLNEVGSKNLQLSNQYFEEVIKFSKNQNQKGKVYSLIGLNYSYLKDFKKADYYYEKSIRTLVENKTNFDSLNYISVLNWKGTNLGQWYNKTGDLNLLDKSIIHYKENVKFWDHLHQKSDSLIQKENDGYRSNALSKLTEVLGKKFLITKDTTFLHESFYYSDRTKYTDFKNRKYSIGEVQKNLKHGESFVQNITSTIPYQEIIFLILKNEVYFINNDKEIESVPYYWMDELHQFTDLKKFQNRSYNLYRSKFRQVDSILKMKGINEVIISNSDFNPMVNYDLIIKDTLSTTWKDQPYLFHDYNFSYSLCIRSFIESRSKKSSLNDKLGLTLGDFENDVDLRFSKKMVNQLQQDYECNTSDVLENLTNNNLVFIVSHGNTNQENRTGEIRTSYNSTFSVDDILQMDLDNDFVMISSCSSNSSQTNYSEGSSGNFSKGLRYSGVQSTLTTSWDIDDKSNSYLMTRFFNYLSDGYPKNVSLWKSKKDYWNKSVDEEEFKPLYWAPYVLTGNIDPIIIHKKTKFQWGWLLMFLIIPIGIFLWKKR